MESGQQNTCQQPEESGTGVDTDDIGAGHGVIQHTLQQRTGQGQSAACQECAENPGEPDIYQDPIHRILGPCPKASPQGSGTVASAAQ